MNEWKVVPVEPDMAMCEAPIREHLEDDVEISCEEAMAIIYKDMLAVAPSPPVMLPPMPPDLNTHCKLLMRAYAISALAQYGIKGQIKGQINE